MMFNDVLNELGIFIEYKRLSNSNKSILEIMRMFYNLKQ